MAEVPAQEDDARGLSLPAEAAGVGPFTNYVNPRLATVRQDIQYMARRGVEVLLGSMEGGEPPRSGENPDRHLTRPPRRC